MCLGNVKNNKNSNKTVEMKNVSMYSGCLGSVSYIWVIISFYSTISGLKCVPNMVRITQNTNADIVVPWPYFSVSELLISATLAMTISNVQQMCPNMSCPNAQLGPKVSNLKGKNAHCMWPIRPLVKNTLQGAACAEMLTLFKAQKCPNGSKIAQCMCPICQLAKKYALECAHTFQGKKP